MRLRSWFLSFICQFLIIFYLQLCRFDSCSSLILLSLFINPPLINAFEQNRPSWRVLCAYVLTAAVLNGFLMCPKHGAELVFVACCQLSHVDSLSYSNSRENADEIGQISAETAPFLVLTAAVWVACCIFTLTSCMFICQVFPHKLERFLH